MTSVIAHLVERDRLASWENEGGAQRSAAIQSPVIAAALWLPRSVIEGPPPELAHGADKGIGDTHTLAILRVSLLVLIPVLAAIAMFWSSLVAARGAG